MFYSLNTLIVTEQPVVQLLTTRLGRRSALSYFFYPYIRLLPMMALVDPPPNPLLPFQAFTLFIMPAQFLLFPLSRFNPSTDIQFWLLFSLLDQLLIAFALFQFISLLLNQFIPFSPLLSNQFIPFIKLLSMPLLFNQFCRLLLKPFKPSLLFIPF